MYLITGLEGLVSSAIVATFVQAGQKVAVLTRPCSSAARYPFPLIQADLLQGKQVQAALAGVGQAFEGILHVAAAMDGVADSQFDEHGDYLNTRMTRNLLAGLEKNPPESLTLISSIDVYDRNATSRPISEATPVRPETDYGKSKLATERLMENWAHRHGVNLLVLRLTQVFGERDRTRKFIPTAMKRIKAGQNLTVFGDGEDLRDYIFSYDAADLALRLTQLKARGVYNLATGTSVSINTALKKIEQISGMEIRVDYAPRRQKRRVDYRFDIGKLTAALPDFPFTDFDQALKHTYEHLS